MQNNPLNLNSVIPTKLFAGLDHISFDTRHFEPSQNDIERLCQFFSIGKLKHYQKEKNIVISHSNFFVFVETAYGQYALKFYPMEQAQTIAIELTVNRFLISHHFPTPIMYTGRDKQPFSIGNGRLATCYSYINGQQAWQQIKQRNIMIKINTALLSLKKILATSRGIFRFQKAENLVTKINALAKTSQALDPYNQKKLISSSLKNACKIYQQYPSLFTRQWLHNNTHLANFLISKETVYTLDLTHIQEDYVLSDLSSLVNSCLLLNIPKKTIRLIVKNYFVQHETKPEYIRILITLVQMELIKEYLLCLHRLKSSNFSAYPTDITHAYRSQLSARMRSIAAFLQPKAINHLI